MNIYPDRADDEKMLERLKNMYNQLDQDGRDILTGVFEVSNYIQNDEVYDKWLGFLNEQTTPVAEDK
jgi:hypothetical protein